MRVLTKIELIIIIYDVKFYSIFINFKYYIFDVYLGRLLHF